MGNKFSTQSNIKRTAITFIIGVAALLMPGLQPKASDMLLSQDSAPISGDAVPSTATQTESANSPEIIPFELPVSNNAYAVSGFQTIPSRLSDGTLIMARGQIWKVDTWEHIKAPSDTRLKIDGKYVMARQGGSETLMIGQSMNRILITTPRMSRKTLRLSVGEAKSLSLNGVVSGQCVSWVSKNHNVAQVYNGTVYGTGPGSTRIYAYTGGVRYYADIYVKATSNTTSLKNVGINKKSRLPYKTTWQVSGNAVIKNNRITTYVAGRSELYGADGHTVIVYGNDTILNTDSGLSFTTRSNTYKLSMMPGEWFVLDFINNHGLPVFSSTNPAVASVNEYGLIYANAPGKTTVYATIGGKRVKIKVTSGRGSSVNKDRIGKVAKTIVEPINGHKGIVMYFDDGKVEYKDYTVKWNKPETLYGSYLGLGDYSGEHTTKKLFKRVRYTDPTGAVLYANPYEAASISVKGGTPVTFEMVAGGSSVSSNIIVNGEKTGKQTGATFFSGETRPDADVAMEFSEIINFYEDGNAGDWIINTKK